MQMRKYTGQFVFLFLFLVVVLVVGVYSSRANRREGLYTNRLPIRPDSPFLERKNPPIIATPGSRPYATPGSRPYATPVIRTLPKSIQPLNR